MDIMLNPFVGAGAVILISVIGIVIYLKQKGILFVSGSRKMVLLLRNRDKRFREIPIVNESDLSLQSVKSKGITRYFVKTGASWSDEKRQRTIFLALEGFCHTLYLNGTASAKFTLKQALIAVCGPSIFEKMPKDFKEKIESATFDITVEPLDPPKNLSGDYVSSEQRHTESDHEMVDYYAKKMREQKKTDWLILLLSAGFGGLVILLAANMHWIKVA